jgi:deoxyadenosine/deoxycytidine kinase
MQSKILKIGICGAHGTGKTTLAENLRIRLKEQHNFELTFLLRTTRDFWQNNGVENFEKLPKDVRTHFQNYILLNQIKREDEEGVKGFLTDRTPLDILGYTIMSSDMNGASFEIFEKLVFERLKVYSVIFYLPVEFEVQQEKLRANIDSRENFANIMEGYIQKWSSKINFKRLSGSIEQRCKQAIENIVKIDV